jgi:hypothetical protein
MQCDTIIKCPGNKSSQITLVESFGIWLHHYCSLLFTSRDYYIHCYSATYYHHFDAPISEKLKIGSNVAKFVKSFSFLFLYFSQPQEWENYLKMTLHLLDEDKNFPQQAQLELEQPTSPFADNNYNYNYTGP